MLLPEKATRKQLIDKVLLFSGWEPVIRVGTERQHGLVALEEYLTDNGARLSVFNELKKAGAEVGTKLDLISDDKKTSLNLRARFPKGNLWADHCLHSYEDSAHFLGIQRYVAPETGFFGETRISGFLPFNRLRIQKSKSKL